MKYPLLILCIGMITLSCKQRFSELKETQDPSHVIMGEAYSGWSNGLKNHSCVILNDSDITSTPPKASELKIESNISYEEISEYIGGNAKLSLDFVSIGIDAAVDFEKDFKQADFVSTLTYAFKATHAKKALNSENSKVKLSQIGQEFIDKLDMVQFQKICGTGFVSDINYETILVGSLIFRFSNFTDKLAFDALVEIEVASFGSFEAALKQIIERSSGNQTITFKALQKGGDHEKLSSAIGSSAVDCSFEKRKACGESFEKFLDYSKGSYYSQITNTDGTVKFDKLIQSSYRVRNYRQANIEGFPTDTVNEGDLLKIQARRLQISSAVLEDKSNLAFVNATRIASSQSNQNYQFELDKLAERITNHMNTYIASEKFCLLDPPNLQRCESEVKTAAENASRLYAYDMAIVHQNPSSFIDYCRKLKQWFVLTDSHTDQDLASTVLDKDSITALQAILNSPSVRKQATSEKFITFKNTDILGPNEYNPIDPLYNCEHMYAAVKTLADLSLVNSYLRNIEVILSATHLKQLDLSINKINGSLFKLSNFAYLEHLNLSNNWLTSLSGVRFKKLKSLILTKNEIPDSDLVHLRESKGLETLTLDENVEVSTLEYLPVLRKLKFLSIKGTSINPEKFADFINRRSEFPALKTIRVGFNLCGLDGGDIELICE